MEPVEPVEVTAGLLTLELVEPVEVLEMVEPVLVFVLRGLPDETGTPALIRGALRTIVGAVRA